MFKLNFKRKKSQTDDNEKVTQEDIVREPERNTSAIPNQTTLNINQLGNVGKLGEDAAADFLKENGYSITARNIKFGKLEIDIIAENPTHIIFVEVKSRTITRYTERSRFGPPSAAVGYRKQMNIVSAARQFLRQYRTPKRKRLDVIEVYVNKYEDGHLGVGKINHFQNAFSCNGRSVR